MKRSVWIMIITIITICCVVGGTVYHVGKYGIGFWGRAEIISKSSDLEPFKVINVDVDLMDVTVMAGESFGMSCQYTEGLDPIYEVKNGVLFVKQKQYRQWGNNNGQCNLSLTIPNQTEMEQIIVLTALGEIQLEEITSAQCDIQSNLGNCTLKKCDFNKTNVNTNMGDISVSDAKLGNAEVSSDMGKIKANSCMFENLSVTTAMGDAAVDAMQNLDQYDMDLGTDFGNVRVNSHNEGSEYHQSGDSGTLRINTNMGSIRLNYRNIE